MFQVEDIKPRPRAFTHTERGVAVLAALLPAHKRASCEGDGRFLREAYGGNRHLEPRELRETCGTCPLFDACAEWGIAHEEYGFWGGMTPEERAVARLIRGQIVVEPHTGYYVDSTFMAPVHVEQRSEAAKKREAARRAESWTEALDYLEGLQHPLDGGIDAEG